MNRLALGGIVALLASGAAVYAYSLRTAPPPPQQAQPEANVAGLTSYAIGYSLGERVRTGMAADGLTGDSDVILRGFQDALLDAEPEIDANLLQQELYRVQAELQRRVIDRELANNEEFRQLVADKLEASEAFMAENGAREGIETGPKGGQWRVLREGTGALPGLHNTVEVNYVAKLIDGTEFERAEGRLFELDSAIPGVQTLLTQMRVGSSWRVFVPPALGYGVAGLPPAVGPNEVLVIEIELVQIVD